MSDEKKIAIITASVVAAIIGNIVQTRGFVFSTKPLEPKIQNIVPHLGQYLKKTIFSLKGAFNVAKSFLKVGIIIFVGYFYIKRDLFILVQISIYHIFVFFVYIYIFFDFINLFFHILCYRNQR